MAADTIFVPDSLDDSACSMPWDEAGDYSDNVPTTTRALQAGVDEDNSLMDGRLSNQWRRIGEARRKFILQEDRRKGGTSFDLNPSCNINRYFQVAHRALEQFHRMYQRGGNLEETFIMGNRMVCFLTECLPNHPGFRRPSVAELRRKSRKDLQLLQKCMEDVALRIDEEQCNKYAEDFDPMVEDDDSESEDEEISAAAGNDWETFGDRKENKRQAESPTNTIATTGTGSLEVIEYSSSDDSMPERQIDFSECEESSPGEPSYLIELGTGFLEMVAMEEVEFETDSEAADSWAQGGDAASFAPSSCSGQGITCDPARIAFRDMKKHLSTSNPLSPIKAEDSDRSLSSRDDAGSPRRPDPPAEISRLPSREERERSDGLHSPAKTPNRRYNEGVRELAVASEIQRFLDASFEYDPSKVFDSSLERLNRVSPSKSDSNDGSLRSHGSQPSGTFPVGGKENALFSGDAFDSEAWVSFDPSLGPSRNFRGPDFYGRLPG